MRKQGLLILLLFIQITFACTTAVISGKYTENGRPIIWKLRDTGHLKNKMVYFEDGNNDYCGLVNSDDKNNEQVWGGTNAAGFAIMNSSSFNVNTDDTTSIKDQEGYFMKQALQICKNLQDFEQMLDTLSKPMGLASHFGVIDAHGGAAFYEVNNDTYTKFDANESAEAPNGYILRTNYSFTGKKDIGYGFIRYQTAENIFYQADAEGKLNTQTIVQDFSRCFKHAVLNRNFEAEYKARPKTDEFVNSGDLITRHGSSSAITIEGVAKGEEPGLTTIWTQVGFPNTCLAVPVWVGGGKNLPNVLVANDTGNSPLNKMSLELKKHCYPIERSSGYKYLKISELFNADKTGIIQMLKPVENKVFAETAKKLNQWHKKYPKSREIQKYYQWLDKLVIDTYHEKFGVAQ